MARLVDKLAQGNLVGRHYLELALASTETPRAFAPVDLTVAIAASAPADVRARGVSLPLELIVYAPSPVNFYRHVYRLVVPPLVSFLPREGGQHLVLLRQPFNNRWSGKLVVEVAGDRAE